jgi:serine protease inhibitor
MDRCVELVEKNFDTWYSAREKEEVNLSLPRYKAEYSTSLKKTLQSMGISDAFTPGKEREDEIGLLDLAPTIADLMEIPRSPDWEGRSLLV